MNDIRYKAVALDLDGTLTDNNKQVPQRNKEAIDRAIAKGIKIILASGRPEFGVKPVAKALNLEEKGGYILACNGGIIRDCNTGEVVYTHMLPRESYSDVIEIGRKYGVHALTYSGDLILAESDTDEYVKKEAICNYTEIMKCDDMVSYIDYDVPKFLVVGEHDILVKVRDELLNRQGAILDAFFSEQYFLEVVPKGIAKDQGLKILLDRLSIKPEELIACGDGDNDIPMLKLSGLPVAMANANNNVMACAAVVTATNEECGVADIIEKYILED